MNCLTILRQFIVFVSVRAINEPSSILFLGGTKYARFLHPPAWRVICLRPQAGGHNE